MQLLILSILLVGLNQAYAQSFGKCASVPVLPDFDATKYLGTWYEAERFDFIFENNLKCVKAQYGAENSTSISVRNSGVNKKSLKDSVVNGYAYVPDVNEPNKLKVVLPIEVAGFTLFQNTGSYNVISTDYDNYALVYSCTQIIPSVLKFEVSWILARSKTLNLELVNKVKEIARQNKIDVSKFQVIDQSCE